MFSISTVVLVSSVAHDNDCHYVLPTCCHLEFKELERAIQCSNNLAKLRLKTRSTAKPYIRAPLPMLWAYESRYVRQLGRNACTQ